MDPQDMTGGPRELTDRELELLRLLEDAISRAESQHYWTLGKSLRSIRDKKLYRGYGGFEDYCRIRWSRPRQTVNRWITAVTVAEDMEAHGVRPPMTEKQARPLGRLSSRERVEVARRVEAEDGFCRVPASRVEQIAEEVAPKPGKEVEPAAPAYLGMALVYRRDGSVRLLPAGRTGILQAIEQMRVGAISVKRPGPHAVFDVVAQLSTEQADQLRDAVADVVGAVEMIAQAIRRHHGDRPQGQQRLAIAA